MKKTFISLLGFFFYTTHLFCGEIVIQPTVLNELKDNPIGINVNFYVDDDKTSKAPKKLSAALREMGVKYLRYPGGDKSDHVLFSIPPFDTVNPKPARMGPGADYGREGFMNNTYDGFKHDPLDFEEFMTVCREAECEPVIVLPADMFKVIRHPEDGRPFYNYNYRSGSPDNTPLTVAENRQLLIDHAAAWVYYANVLKNYNVKYWIIGNETEVAYWPTTYGDQSCNADDYSRLLIDFSNAMKAVSGNIEIIANGAAWLVEHYLNYPGVVDAIDHVCCSNYPFMQFSSTSYSQWANKSIAGGNLILPLEDVLSKIEANPAARAKGIDVWASEFSSMYTEGWDNGLDLGHAMANMDIIGQALQNPRFGKIIYWNTRWGGNWDGNGEIPLWADFDGLLPNNDLTPRGFSVSLFARYLYPKIVQTSATVNGNYDGIITYASRSQDDNSFYLYVINTKGILENMALSVTGKNILNIKRMAEMYGDTPQKGGWSGMDWNWRTDLPEMNRTEYVISGTSLPVKPYSASVYHITTEPLIEIIIDDVENDA
jgi:hypothetical protein